MNHSGFETGPARRVMAFFVIVFCGEFNLNF